MEDFFDDFEDDFDNGDCMDDDPFEDGLDGDAENDDPFDGESLPVQVPTRSVSVAAVHLLPA